MIKMIPNWVYVIVIAVAVWIFHVQILTSMGMFLVDEDPVQPADMIIVLAGDSGERVEAAAMLYQQHIAPRMIMAGGDKLYLKTIPEYMADYAVALGVPPTAILIEKKAKNTLENAIFLKKILEAAHVRRVVIVTSHFHTRRTKWIFDRAFEGTSIEFSVVGVQDDIQYTEWWKHHEMAETILTEWTKTIIYWWQYQLLKSPQKLATQL